MADIEINIASDYDGRDTDRARDDLKGVGDEAKRTGDRFRGAREQADGHAAALKRLGDQARTIRTEMERLTIEYGKGSDEALKGLTAQERKLREIEQQTRRLTKVEQDRAKSLRESLGGGGGGGRGGGLLSGLGGVAGGAGRAGGSLLDLLPTSPMDLAMLGLLFQTALPALPLAGGAVIGAAGLGVTGGVIGAGVAGAIADDPDLYAGKWEDAIGRISRRWQDASEDFGGPVLRSIDKFEDALDDVPLERILGNAAKLVDPLVTGIGEVVRGAGAAVDKIIAAAGPYITELQEELPELGKDITVIGDMIAESSEGGAQALGDTLDVVGSLAKGFTGLAGSVASYYESWREQDPTAFREFWAQAIDGDMAGTIAERIRDFFVKPLEDAEEQARQTQEAMDNLFNTWMDADEANTAVKESLASLKEELKEGKRTLDDNTQAGRDNVGAIRDHIKSLEDQRQANIAAGQDQATANAKFYEGVAAVRALLTQLGYAPGEIDKLIAKWMELYSKPNIYKTYTLSYIENMSATAGKRGQSKDFGGAGNNAAGGPAESWATGGGSTWMHEMGWEAVTLPNGSHVLPSSNTALLLDDLAKGGGSSGTRIEVVFRDDSTLGAMFLEAQRRGDVQVLTSSIVDG